MARGTGLRPWKRGTEAQRSARGDALPSGDLVITDEGNVYAGDGTTFLSALKRLVRLDEVTTAVQQYVTSLVVTNATLQTLAEETGYVQVWVDQNGRRAMGVRADGSVEVSKLTLAAGSIPVASLGSDVPLPVPANMDESDYAMVWSDTNSRLALWIRRNGKIGFAGLDTATILYLSQALALDGVIAPTNYKTPEGVTRAITSGPDIVCWGDSLTAGAGATTAAGNYAAISSGGYPAVLAVSSGRTVRNSGVGGETSVTITARTGATPFLLLPVGGQIPASGGVVVTLSPINGTAPQPLKQGTGGSFIGSLAGVPGLLTLDSTSGSDVYTFTRTAPGSAVPLTRPAVYRTDYSAARRGDIVVLWLGQNGPSNARAIADAQAIIGHLSTLNKRFLVMSKPSSTDAEDSAWHDAFGRRFIAIRRYLVDYGLADAGIAPTTQDTTDIAAGTVPTSLRIDSVHGNAAYYNIVAQQVDARLREFGWI